MSETKKKYLLVRGKKPKKKRNQDKRGKEEPPLKPNERSAQALNELQQKLNEFQKRLKDHKTINEDDISKMGELVNLVKKGEKNIKRKQTKIHKKFE